MKKIRLDVDALVMEAFETVPPEEAMGTVLADAVTNHRLSDCPNTCDGYPTSSCPPIVCA